MAWLGRIIFLVLDCFFLKPSSALENAEFLNLANNTKEQVSFFDPSYFTVVVFLSAKCPCSRSHLPIIKNLAIKYPRFHFIGIQSNEDEDLRMSQTYFKENNLPFPVYRDSHFKLANHFSALKTPHVFLIGKKSEILFTGGVDDTRSDHPKENYLEKAIEELTLGKEISTPKARVLGCAIER